MGRGYQQIGRGGGGRRGRHGRGRGRGRHQQDFNNHPPEGNSLDFTVKSSHPDAIPLLDSSPATLVSHPEDSTAEQINNSIHHFHLNSWADLTSLLVWFKQLILIDPDAILSFSPSLAKPHRALIYNTIDEAPPDLRATIIPFSQGFGNQRHTSIAKRRQPSSSSSSPSKSIDGMKTTVAGASESDMNKAFMLRRWVKKDLGVELSRDESIELILAIIDSNSNSNSNTNTIPSDIAAVWHTRYPLQQAAHALNQAIVKFDITELSSLIDQHSTAITTGSYDETTGLGPLHIAASQGFIEGIDMLISAGYPVDAKDASGMTALDVSRKFEQCDAEGVLLQCGAYDSSEGKKDFLLDGDGLELGDDSNGNNSSGSNSNGSNNNDATTTTPSTIGAFTIDTPSNSNSNSNSSSSCGGRSSTWASWARDKLYGTASTTSSSSFSSSMMIASASVAAVAIGVAAVVVAARGRRRW